MFCKNCGTELQDGTRFCTQCGADQTAPMTAYPSKSGRPSTHMALSIIVTLCCCIPFGVVGIVYAAKVDPAWNAGRLQEAREYSRKARNWSLWGIGLTLLFYLAYIILIVAGVSWAMWWENTDAYFTCLM